MSWDFFLGLLVGAGLALVALALTRAGSHRPKLRLPERPDVWAAYQAELIRSKPTRQEGRRIVQTILSRGGN